MLDFTRFEVLTFDCYGTLIDWEAGILSALRRILSAHNKQIDDATLLKLYGDFELRSEEGAFHPYRQVLESVVRQFAAELRFTPTPDEVHSLPDSLSAWKPWPDTVAALRQLKTRFRLAILSNVDDDLLSSTLSHFTVRFDLLITAQQVRSYKPALRHFHTARERIGKNRRWLHAAQSFFHDIVPAHALGIPVAWVNRKEQARQPDISPDMEVKTLGGLADRLDRFGA